MKKLLVFVFTIVILFTGCGKKERIYLDDKYYGNNELIEIPLLDFKAPIIQSYYITTSSKNKFSKIQNFINFSSI